MSATPRFFLNRPYFSQLSPNKKRFSLSKDTSKNLEFEARWGFATTFPDDKTKRNRGTAQVVDSNADPRDLPDSVDGGRKLTIHCFGGLAMKDSMPVSNFFTHNDDDDEEYR